MHIAIRHKTSYQFNRSIILGPHVIRLRPAPHGRAPIVRYDLNVLPAKHFLHWHNDLHGNYLARLVFPETVNCLIVDVHLVVDMTPVNPFDFFVDQQAESYPVCYEQELKSDLQPFLENVESSDSLADFVKSIELHQQSTVELLVKTTQRVSQVIRYKSRLDPGVQTCSQTLEKGVGSCRDTSWLLVQLLRRLGIAARFASGYLVQLAGSSSLEAETLTDDTVDLHAWAEAYLPGAGWIGLDPTSGYLTGEGHIPLACSPRPDSASAIAGTCEECDATFDFSMSVTRAPATTLS